MFLLISEIKRIWIRFTCVSLFHYKISLLFFASFRFNFFASLHFSHFCFEVKQREAKFKSIFSLFFHIFSLFFALHFSLCFDLVIFASKRNKAKQNSSLFFRSFRFFSLFFAFFAFFHYFRFFFVSLRFLHLIFAYFTFVFASDFWCFALKWIMWNQAFFSLPSEAKFSLQFQISLPKRKRGRTLVTTFKELGYAVPVDNEVTSERRQWIAANKKTIPKTKKTVNNCQWLGRP